MHRLGMAGPNRVVGMPKCATFFVHGGALVLEKTAWRQVPLLWSSPRQESR